MNTVVDTTSQFCGVVKDEVKDTNVTFNVGEHAQNIKTSLCFVIARIEDNGLFKLLDHKQKKSWIREDILAKLYTKVSKEDAYKMINNAVQSSAANKDKKGTDVPKTKKTILERAQKAGEDAKDTNKFKYRVEQVNNFRQMFVYDNESVQRQRVGMGAAVAGRILSYEAEIESLKVTVTHKKYKYKAADNKAKYNPNVKHSKYVCVECQKEGKKHYISEAEVKYLKDNQKYLPDELKGVALCYKHQATTGVRRYIINNRRDDVQAGDTTLGNNSKSLLK